MRPWGALVAGVVLVGALAGCGDESGTTATDPPTTTSATTDAVGSARPHYGPGDYSFTLTRSCFCAGSGAPMRVTVRDRSVATASYLADGRGVSKGDSALGFAVTIDDVIDAANGADGAVTDLVWPADEDYPTSVTVDTSAHAVDDVVSYSLADVSPVSN